MKNNNSILEKVVTVAGGYEGAKTGSDFAANIVYGTNIGKNMPAVILIDFICMFAGCGIGAFIGNKSSKIVNKLVKK